MREPRIRRNRKGQALIEFALVLPILLLVVVGMLEFARAWNLHQVMTDAVREGARRAVLANDWPVDSVYAPMWRYMEQAGYQAIYASMGVCNGEPPNPNCGSTARPAAESNFKVHNELMTVSLSFPYRIWILGGGAGRAIIMKSSLTVRNE
jgi:hypothetical protein